MRVVGVFVALAAIGGGGWLGYGKFLAPPEVNPFTVKTLARGDIVRTVTATGTIEPLVKVIVGSQVSGTILKWYADFNDDVTEGFLLARIDPDRFQTALNQAKANLSLAKAREEELRVRFKDAERERKRIQGLFELSNASENELFVQQADEDAARAAWHGGEAGVESAEAALNAAKVDLERTYIRSPIDGVVISRNIEDGQTVAASLQAPELFLIANNLRRMQVYANVSESDIGQVKEGKPAKFHVDAYPDRTFSGTISQIRFNASDEESVVTYVTLIEVENKDLALRPGMTANVTFEVARADDVVRIPNAALRFDPRPRQAIEQSRRRKQRAQSPAVYVLEGGRPVRKEVEIGLSDGAVTELRSEGLEDGDKVITERNWRAGRGRRPDPTRSMRRGMR